MRVATRMLSVAAACTACLTPACAPQPGAPTPAADSEVMVHIPLAAAPDLKTLPLGVSADGVFADASGRYLRAYTTGQGLQALRQGGWAPELMPHPGDTAQVRMAKSLPEFTSTWDTYPTYSQYVALMQSFVLKYPALCRLEVIGTSQNGHELLALVISLSPGVESDEPEILLTSSMHGDELTGFVTLLRLADTLLYEFDRKLQINKLIAGSEIWINPLANPDGAYRRSDNTVRGARRFLANGVDANRNFPDPEDGDHPDRRSWAPETLAMMALATRQSFNLSANFHGGAELVNYPWDTWSHTHPDEGWFYDMSRSWADSAQANGPAGYMTDQDNGTTNGYAWYEVNGGRQDYMAWWHGGREVTVELSSAKTPDPSTLPAYWEANYQALVDFLILSQQGVRGLVTNAAGEPLAATIEVLGHDADHSQVFTDPDVGDYHRFLTPGFYDLKISAAGYADKIVEGVEVGADPYGYAARVNVQLEAL